MPPLLEIARGLFVIIAAAGLGSMISAVPLGLHPLGGLSLLPFTLFGSAAVLLPAYLWARDIKGWERRRCYISVVISGAVGGFLILFLFFLAMGGLTTDASTALLRFYMLGALFGVSSATSWVALHYVTRGRRRLKV